ncbi:MAG: phosphotransferase [Caulobacteraceae bacterium]
MNLPERRPETPLASFPAAIEAITPRWLTGVVGRGLGGARIVDFAVEPVGAGVGFVGVVARLRLIYDRKGPAGPASVIVKLPSDDPGARMMAATFRHWEKEVGFYRDIAQNNPMISPRAYFHAFDPATLDFNLVLEDLSPARNGDQLAGLTVDDAAVAVEALAPMHAKWWQSSELHAVGWLPALDDPSLLALQPAFRRCWDRYRAFSGGEIDATLVAAGERLSSRIADLLVALAARPRTLVHGDYRADNLLFDGAASPVAVVDWQLVHKGPGIHDLAYLLVGNLDIDDRRAAEADLGRLYLAALRAGGVGYGEEAAWRDYRVCIALGWIWTVVGIGSLDLTNARGAAVFHAWNRRLAAAMLDLDAPRAVWDFLA